MEPLTAIPNLIEQVHLRLLDAIADGTLGPGVRITQEELAEHLAVSRQPVSHALQLLKRRGLVVEQGKRGLAVAPVEPGRMRDLYQVRAALDGLASRLAAERVATRQAAKREMEALRVAFATGRALDNEVTVHQLIEADVAFHASVYGLSGNPAIGETVGEQWPHFKRCMGLVLADPGRRDSVWVEHADITERIFAGDPEGAQRASVDHAERAGKALYEGLKEMRD